MVANSYEQEPNDDQWQDNYDHDDDEETLSLCDLPLYSGSFESYQCSVDDDDQDLFEFISGDLTTSSTKNSSSTFAYADNLFFCGKLIPYQAPPVFEAPDKPLQITTNTENQPQEEFPNKKKTFFQWRSSKKYRKASNNGKTVITNNAQNKMSDSKALTLSASSKGSIGNNKKYGYPVVKKVSILTSPTKSRWPLFLGFARVQTEMELSDIRNRQRRRRLSPSSSSSITSFHDDDEIKVMKDGKSSSSGKGLWGMLSVLGCGNSHARTIAKASVGCFSML